MQITIRPTEIVSRLVALLLVALPLAGLTQWMGELEQQEIARMSHAELKQYMSEGHDPGFAGNYARVAVLTAVYVLLVEGVALAIRLGVRAVQTQPDAAAGD